MLVFPAAAGGSEDLAGTPEKPVTLSWLVQADAPDLVYYQVGRCSGAHVLMLAGTWTSAQPASTTSNLLLHICLAPVALVRWP